MRPAADCLRAFCIFSRFVPTLTPASYLLSPISYFFTTSSRPLCRAAALRWMRPFLAERSSN